MSETITTRPSRASVIGWSIFLLLLIGVPLSTLLWMTAVPGHSYTGPLPPPDPAQKQLAARLETHVRAIASVPHNIEHPRALEASALYIESTLTGLGYTVRRDPLEPGRDERNLEVVIEPAAPSAQTLVIGAHYDSAFDAPGANDNASGAAGVIELARMLVICAGNRRFASGSSCSSMRSRPISRPAIWAASSMPSASPPRMNRSWG